MTNVGGEGKTSAVALWLAWVGTFLLFVCVAHGNFETTDAGFTMHAARSLWHRGDSALLTAEQGGDLIGEQMGAAHIITSERKGGRISGKIGINGHAYVWYPIGHVFLMVPFIALGEAVADWLPDADTRFQQKVSGVTQSFIEGSPVVTQGVISLLLPSLCFATSIMLLFLIARELGGSQRDAIWTALAIGLATQAFALGREQLSDGPGLMLLLATLLPIARIHRGTHSRKTALWAGLMGGAAVLLRYQTAFAVMAFSLVLLLACRRRKQYRDLKMFAIGGVPMLLLFLLTNYLRFGNPLITGYPEVGDWFTASPLAGMTKLLFAAGRGIMWFSPILWLAVPYVLQWRTKVQLRWLAWVLFATPLLIFMTAQGWQGGQAWAIRYVTPGVVALLVIGLPQTRPWQHWPRSWRALVAIGCFVSITSVMAPVRGQIQLMSQAVQAERALAVSEGRLPAAEQIVDTADYGGWHPNYTPLVANWLYALHSRTGYFEDENGKPRNGGENSIIPIYGVAPVERGPDAKGSDTQGNVPTHWADRCGRHLWWCFWGDLYGINRWLLVLPVAVLGALLSFLGWRKLDGPSHSSTTHEIETAGG